MDKEQIFTAAIELADPVERGAFLDEVCREDAQLRAEVDALLKHDAEAGSFLDRPVAAVDATMVLEQTVEPPGAVIAGRYKLLEAIGEGGMGTVWVAQQTAPVRRRVALKLVKLGMDSRQVLSRFEAERQALALMDHPNIAKVLDGGVTDQGRPFFVMEYVKGLPINEYCNQARLTVQERLKLFVQVCQAVQHAHQKGIIHRDLKPSNILVCLYDGQPVPKVIDFGLAKAIQQPLTEHSLYTAHGMMVGTPLYMSPEQAEFNNLDIDTRTDVYSLGVILYELLTGATPLDRQRFKDAAWQEIVRLIKEEEPSKPSTKLSGSGALPSIAAQRNLEPAQLSRMVRGDLDWIVMKSLEKERSRRYETANGLARDIERYLHDDPVEACPPSSVYRFRKFARRNRVALVTASFVSVALVLGTVISTWQAVRATRAEGRADAARADEAGQRKRAEEQQGIAEAERIKAEEQRTAAEANLQKAKAAVDEYFTLVSESTLLDVPGLQPLRKELLEAALRFYKLTALERTSDSSALADLAVTYLRVAEVDHAIDRNDDAMVAVGQALDVVDRLRREHPEAHEQHRQVAGFWKGLRRVTVSTRTPRNETAARDTLARLVSTWQQLGDENPAEIGFQSDLAAIHQHIGELLAWNSPNEALPWLEKSLAILDRLVRDYPQTPVYRADLARGCEYLVQALKRADRSNETEVYFRRALALREQLVSEYPKVPQYRIELAINLDQLGNRVLTIDPQEAERAARRAVGLAESLVIESPGVSLYSRQFTTNLLTLAKVLQAVAKPPEAAEVIERAIKFNEKLAVDYPQRPSNVRDLMAMYARIARLQSGHEQLQIIRNALSSYRQVLDATQGLREFPASDGLIGDSDGDLYALAELLAQSGQSAEAVETAEQIIEIAEENAPARPGGFVALAHACRWLCNTRGHEKEYLRKAIAAFERTLVDQPNDEVSRAFLADTLIILGPRLNTPEESGEAEACIRKAMGVYEALAAEFPANQKYRAELAQCHFYLIEVVLAQAKYAESEATIRGAVEKFGRLVAAYPAVPDYQRLLAACQRQLAQLLASGQRSEEAEKAFLVAITSYEQIIAEFPQYQDLPLVYGGLAQALAASNRPREADEAYRQFVQLVGKDAAAINTLAWTLATSPDPRLRDSAMTVELSRKAVELEPMSGFYWQTLGVALYRVGDWKDALAALEKVKELGSDGDSLEWFPLAMAHWQLGNQEEARKLYAKAVAWMEKNAPTNEDLKHFRAEADELLGITQSSPASNVAPPSDPARPQH